MNLALPKNKLINRYLGKANVFLTVCTHRTINIDVMGQIMSLAKNSKHNFTWMPSIGDALLSRSRSRAASHFLLNSDADILMFCDDDILFTFKDSDKLIDDIMDGCDIVSGTYVQKGVLGKTWVQFNDQIVKFGKNEKPVEVEAVPTGFLAIHRRVLDGLSKTIPLCHPGTLNFYPFFCPYPAEKNGKWVLLGEDWAFCDLARKNGFKVFIDPSILLRHVGEYAYDMADSLRLPKPRLEDIEMTLK